MASINKPILLEKFKINPRVIAEGKWGKIGKKSYKTNRKWTFYYSCYSNEGYIVDSRALTEEEKKQINKYIKPLNLYLAIQEYKNTNDLFVIGVNYSSIYYAKHNKKIFPTKKGDDWDEPYWYKLPIYLFQTDYELEILKKFTDIKIKKIINLN